MADLLDFPDIVTRLPRWPIIAISLFLIALAAKMALRWLKVLLLGGLGVATIYLLFNSA